MGVVFGASLIWAVTGLAVAAPLDLDALRAAGAERCEGHRTFWCGQVALPEDPSDPTAGSFSLSFAVRPASGRRSLGPLVLVDGGPGVSGLAWIDDLRWIDRKLRRRFDLVYYDQRGTAQSGDFVCPAATAAWMAADFHPANAQEAAVLAEAAERFGAACVAEAGWTADRLARLNTESAVADLDGLRAALGFERLTLYGLSYGSQLTQTYTTTHPDRVRALVLDGVVDLTVDGPTYSLELHRAVNTTLAETFDACARDRACASAFPDPRAAWTRLAERLAAAPVEVTVPLAGGRSVTRPFTRSDLETGAHAAMGDPSGRTALLRALADADQRDDWLPLRALTDDAVGLDPETGVYSSEDYSDGMYYAVTCNDYGRPEAGADAWLVHGRGAGVRPPLLRSAIYGDMPCATWPTAPPATPRPEPFRPEGVPLLVLNATADVATPVVQGQRVAEALRGREAPTHRVDVEGASHVLWGLGTCADPAVSTFLFAPEANVLPGHATCFGGWIDRY